MTLLSPKQKTKQTEVLMYPYENGIITEHLHTFANSHPLRQTDDWHNDSNGKSPLIIGNASSNGGFSVAMLYAEVPPFLMAMAEISLFYWGWKPSETTNWRWRAFCISLSFREDCFLLLDLGATGENCKSQSYWCQDVMTKEFLRPILHHLTMVFFW